MNGSLRTIFQKSTALVSVAAIVAMGTGTAAYAVDPNTLPTGGQFVTGTGSFSNPNSTTLNLNQTSNSAHAQFTNLDLGSNGTFNINGGQFTLLSTTSNLPTTWEGTVNSDHNVALMNDKGLTMTSTFRGNLGSFVATTAKNVSNNGNNYTFSNVNGTGVITNQGQINVSDGGYAILVAPEVHNTGTINAKLGRVELAAVNGFTVDVNGNGNINYLAGPDLTKAIVEAGGTINAQGGVVRLRSDKAANLADSVINLNGVINVDGMDANIMGTSPNGSAILAQAYGNVNATQNLKAGQIQLVSTNGNVTTQGLESINYRTLNSAAVPAIEVTATNGQVVINGPVTAINAKKADDTQPWSKTNLKNLGFDTGSANATVKVTAKNGVWTYGKIQVLAQNQAGAEAHLNITGNQGNTTHTGDVITNAPIDVYAAGSRILETDAQGHIIQEDGGDTFVNATADFNGAAVRHNGDVNVKAYAFQDINKFIELLSKNVDDNTVFGFYTKDKDGNPVNGEILLSNLANILPGSWASLNFVDFSNVGFFIIPDASDLATLGNRQPVSFAQVNGNWVVKDSGGNIIKGKDIGGSVGQNYALFSDKTLNADGNYHLVNSAADGEMNWEQATDLLCNFNDFNFSVDTTGGNSTVKTYAKYEANATQYLYTAAPGAAGGANIFVDSIADAKNSEAQAEFIATSDKWMALGDPHVTSMAYKNAYSNIDLTAKGNGTSLDANGQPIPNNLWINAPLVAQSYAASRKVGSANSRIDIDVQNGNFDHGFIPGATVIADSLGGVKANSNTLVHASNYIASGDLIGAVAKTFTGQNATATTTLHTTRADGIAFTNTGYGFSNANGVVVSGQSNKNSNGANLVVTTGGAKPASTTTYTAGTGDTHDGLAVAVTNCGVTNPCDINPNTDTVGGWNTTSGVTGTAHADTSGRTYGNGTTVAPVAFPPYQVIKVGVLTPPPTPTPSPTPPTQLDAIEKPFEGPEFVRQEPASGSGLFCRDVNTAGMPGLCGPAPVQEVAFAPIVEEAPAPVYATPFKKGKSEGKKAEVANLEPGSGNKCLVVNGKKVCIEEQIDK